MTRLSHWSQRKRGIEPSEETPANDRADALADSSPNDGPPGTEPASAAPSQATPREEMAAELPDPDTLPPDSDLTAYLASGVSREFRRRALKRLFAADHYHQRDGLNDYDDDYRQLKKLSQEVADRLRQWTRHREDDAEGQPLASDDTGNTASNPSQQATQETADSKESPDSQPDEAPPADDLADGTARQEADPVPPPRHSGELSKR